MGELKCAFRSLILRLWMLMQWQLQGKLRSSRRCLAQSRLLRGDHPVAVLPPFQLYMPAR